MQIDISQTTLARLAALAYADWAEAVDNQKVVHAEEDDGSPDWKKFHKARLVGAVHYTQEARAVLDEVSNLVRPMWERALATDADA